MALTGSSDWRVGIGASHGRRKGVVATCRSGSTGGGIAKDVQTQQILARLGRTVSRTTTQALASTALTEEYNVPT